ncbi:alanine/glycine:cation symporter family protein [Oscillatoria sp. CS-180]|uniref:alanine/glycine:cation symporter family protein n=1 Tax=Oscillatoria sp. CS-180 TaxID=3021720 RepID=UPI00232B7E78|nr:alanine/glycine:cation symporter family protein [Oscillatoria sp. CS-180]MDB9525711.1 alanine/glycine:cation symporter family protein [Oscillatoria sp. CS-180]
MSINGLEQTLFFSVGGLPIIVLWLLLGAIFFTLRMGFINVRAFKHAINITLGRYDSPDEPGEVSHFQAIATALSATVGLGNIAGVAIAIQLGGPGAVVWMTLAGFLGMSTKFVECTLAQQYRTIRVDGTIAGGPMYYLSQGLAKQGFKSMGRILAMSFALLCALGAVGGGNMFQASQTQAAVTHVLPVVREYTWVYGLGLSTVVGLVIVGGIRRIGAVAGTIVPTMVGVYILASIWVVLTNLSDIPGAVVLITQEAFNPQTVAGGMVGVLVQGIRRGFFSNSAGNGSAAIAHAATRTQEPAREGIVASLEPFIDTVVICNITALVCIVTGAYQRAPQSALGFELVATAFETSVPGFSVLLTFAVCLFAFSTIVSWAYYGEQCWRYLTGDRFVLTYRLLYVGFTFVGTVTQPSTVLALSDMMLFAIAIPNLIGCIWLSSDVARSLEDYWQRLTSGKMPIHGVKL